MRELRIAVGRFLKIVFLLFVFVNISKASLVAHWQFDEGQGTATGPLAIQNGLVSYWNFDGDVADSVGNNNGTLSGDALLVNNSTGMCLSTDGNADSVVINHDDSLNFVNGITVCAWINTTEIINTQTIIVKGSETPNYSLEIPRAAIGGGIRFFGYESGVPQGITTYGGPHQVTDGNWHFIAATFDGEKWEIYDNAQIYRSLIDTANLTSTTESLYIGERKIKDRYFNGLIDDVAIYNRALSAQEIYQIYIPEPTTILLFGLGAMLLKRFKTPVQI